jgi:outer membrane protein OmpA-like peptidoglycan-associated protein
MWILMAAVLLIALSVPAWSVDLTGKWGITLQGGAWKQALTDHSDYWTLGPFGSFGVKYGINPNIAVGATGYWMQTYIADLTDASVLADGAGLTFNNLDGGYRQRNFLFEGTVEYHFLPDNEKFSPYVLGGAGIYIWAWKNSEWETLTSDSFQVAPYTPMGIPPTDNGTPAALYELKDKEIALVGGGGLEWFPIPELAINASAKFHFLTHFLTDFKDDQDIVGTGAGELDLPKGLAEAAVGVTYYVGAKKDTDKDGIPDELDQCPDTPIGAFVDASGCPLDADADGVYDGLDKCPDTPKGAKVDMNGCPMDSDADGVFDGIDQCASTPSGVKVDAKGCPMDADGDGVADYQDKCPNTSKGCSVDASGCEVDSDGDGICDGVDRCPNTPSGVEVDDFGCPTVPPLPEKSVLYIKYAPGSAEIDMQSMQELDKIATSLKTYKDIKVEVGGYTDASGSAEYNLTLSQKRSDKVKEALVKQGVDPARITAKGYGETGFVASNDTPEGRAQNRRVEIVVKR